MARTNTKQKPGNNRSSGLQEALTRRDVRNIRFLYEDAIQHYAQHLKECHKTECPECKDAEVLIPYYRAGMKKALWNISAQNKRTTTNSTTTKTG
ncbi:MAG: hypothetical protein KKH28_06750 [Elusimicrobia bacterium]|nr:hypothetical protein [Elusimicrobiota bacterium]